MTADCSSRMASRASPGLACGVACASSPAFRRCATRRLGRRRLGPLQCEVVVDTQSLLDGDRSALEEAPPLLPDASAGAALGPARLPRSPPHLHDVAVRRRRTGRPSAASRAVVGSARTKTDRARHAALLVSDSHWSGALSCPRSNQLSMDVTHLAEAPVGTWRAPNSIRPSTRRADASHLCKQTRPSGSSFKSREQAVRTRA